MVDQHVLPHAEGWAVREATNRNIHIIFDTKEEAVAYARERAKSQKGDLVIHEVGWQVEEREEYSRDSHPAEIQTE